MGINQKYSKKKVKDFFNGYHYKHSAGVLSDYALKKAIYSRDIFIYPYQECCVTPIGYNFCPSEVIISTRTGLPIEICSKHGKKYINVAPHDTVLVSTREYLSISSRIMGTFHSRVTIVSSGFGHISTTLDAGWNGPLLIALNNPSSRRLKLLISDNNNPVPFVTIIFYWLCEKAHKQHDNPPYRTDVFRQYLAKPNYVKKVILGRSYENYKQMVELISESMDLTQIQKNSYPLLCELEQCICDIQNTYLVEQDTADERKMAVVRLLRCIEKAEKSSELSGDLMEVLYYLYWGMEYFDIQQQPWEGRRSSFKKVLLPFLDLCYMKIQDEMVGKFWIQRYEEIREMTTVCNRRFRLILGVRWSRVIFFTAIFAALIAVIVSIREFNGLNIAQYILAPILAAMFTSIILKLNQ